MGHTHLALWRIKTNCISFVKNHQEFNPDKKSRVCLTRYLHGATINRKLTDIKEQQP